MRRRKRSGEEEEEKWGGGGREVGRRRKRSGEEEEEKWGGGGREVGRRRKRSGEEEEGVFVFVLTLGSVIAKQERISPLSRGFNHWSYKGMGRRAVMGMGRRLLQFQYKEALIEVQIPSVAGSHTSQVPPCCLCLAHCS